MEQSGFEGVSPRTSGSSLPPVGILAGMKRPREHGQQETAENGEIHGQHQRQQTATNPPADNATSIAADSLTRNRVSSATTETIMKTGTAQVTQSSHVATTSATCLSTTASAAQPMPVRPSAGAAAAQVAEPTLRPPSPNSRETPVGPVGTATSRDAPANEDWGVGGVGGGEGGFEAPAAAAAAAAEMAVEKCQVCKEQDRRYCCPRCGKLTCSLPCCLRHKNEEGCNGQRDKVAFVGLKDFTDAHLRSDFNFLEDAIRCVDGGRRELSRRPGLLGNSRQQNKASMSGRGCGRGKIRGRQHQHQHQQQQHGEGLADGPPAGDAAAAASSDGDGGALGLLSPRGQGWLLGRPPKLQRLVKEAAFRGTRLLLMPDGMARRDGNTTTVVGAPGRGRRSFSSKRGSGGRRSGGGRVGGGSRGRGSRGGGTRGGRVTDGAGAAPRAEATSAPRGAGTVLENAGGSGGGGADVQWPVSQGGPPRIASVTAAAVEGTGASNHLDGKTAPVSSFSSSPPELAPLSPLPPVSPPRRPVPTSTSTSRELLDIEASRPFLRGGDITAGAAPKESSAGRGVGGSSNAAVRVGTTLLWKVEWVFCDLMAGTKPQGSNAGTAGSLGAGEDTNARHSTAAAAAVPGRDKHGDVTLSDPTVSEGLSLHEALAKHLEPRPGNAPLRHRLKSFAKAWSIDAAAAAAVTSAAAAAAAAAAGGDSATADGTSCSVAEAGALRVEQQKPLLLQQRQLHLGARQLQFFLRRVPCAAKAPLYWELDGGEPLGTALKEKTVIEHPTVYVAVRGDDKTASRFRTLVSNASEAEAPAFFKSGDTSLVIQELEKALAPPPPPPQTERMVSAAGKMPAVTAAATATAAAANGGEGVQALATMITQSEVDEEDEHEEEEEEDSGDLESGSESSASSWSASDSSCSSCSEDESSDD